MIDTLSVLMRELGCSPREALVRYTTQLIDDITQDPGIQDALRRYQASGDYDDYWRETLMVLDCHFRRKTDALKEELAGLDHDAEQLRGFITNIIGKQNEI